MPKGMSSGMGGISQLYSIKIHETCFVTLHDWKVECFGMIKTTWYSSETTLLTSIAQNKQRWKKCNYCQKLVMKATIAFLATMQTLGYFTIA